MRVLYLTASAQLGGGETSALDMLAGLRAVHPNWELGLIAPGEGPLLERGRELGIWCRSVPFVSSLLRLGDAGDRVSRSRLIPRMLRAFPATLLHLFRLRRAIRQFAPELVHAHGFKMLVLSACAAPAAVPLIWHLHDFLSPRPALRKLIPAVKGRCALAIANSFSTAADFRGICGNRLPVVTSYYAVDRNRFRPDGGAMNLDECAGMPAAPAGTVRVGLVATLAFWKGHSDFLRAIALLPLDLPIRAYIIGGPLYETVGSQTSLRELRQLAQDLGIGDKVGFTGYTGDSPAAMRSLDVVVHASSRPEPFGLVIAEAMATGRPVILSEAGGAAEILQMTGGAVGFPPGDASALADRIRQLVTDPELRRGLAEQGRKSVAVHFTSARLANDLTHLYEQVRSLPTDGRTEPQTAILPERV